jgi:hypothetical protein
MKNFNHEGEKVEERRKNKEETTYFDPLFAFCAFAVDILTV